MDYYVHMYATEETYEYSILEMEGEDVNRHTKVTFMDIHNMFPEFVYDNVSALIYAQEYSKEILDKFVKE